MNSRLKVFPLTGQQFETLMSNFDADIKVNYKDVFDTIDNMFPFLDSEEFDDVALGVLIELGEIG
jgi:hypothetical protein